MSDPQGRTLSIGYGALDRPLRVVDNLGNSVSYDYDEVGNLTLFTDSRLGPTNYHFDVLDRLDRKTYPV